MYNHKLIASMESSDKTNKITIKMIAYISIYIITLLLIINMITRLDRTNNSDTIKEKMKYGVNQ